MKTLSSKRRAAWVVLAVGAAVAGLALVSPQAFAGGGGAPGSAAVDAEVLGVSVVRRADRTRAVMVELRTDERITVQVPHLSARGPHRALQGVPDREAGQVARLLLAAGARQRRPGDRARSARGPGGQRGLVPPAHPDTRPLAASTR